MNHLINLAKQWADQDPDSETREALYALINTNNTDELEKRFSGRLQFGTAGLRGPLQAGPTGMNRVLVAQAAAGLAQYLLKQEKPSSKTLRIVIGYDARKNSYRFAQDTAEIMQGAGIEAYLMPELRPTPVLAFAVRELNADAGVMVTASHNPPQDNGYKVYLGGEDDGAQIIPPKDKAIAEEIQWVADNFRVDELTRNSDYQLIDDSVVQAYIARTASLATAKLNDSSDDLTYVYTAMHGVGTETLLAVLAQAGLAKPTLVEQQCTPDGNFPTVAFPNPEEDGALDLAIAKAQAINADFIVANDPDADRLAVALPNDDGEWQMLHGNEIGLYLAWFIAERAQAAGKKGTLACSLVSSPVLRDVAQKCAMDYQETLTGFKWIGRAPNLLFGYEEALGYLVNPSNAHDKDGISALVCFLDLMNTLRAEGRTFAEFRHSFAETFGAFFSDQLSIRVEELERIHRLLKSVRDKPFADIAGYAVTDYIDHLHTEKCSDILVFHLEGGHRVIFRPSGTEPKLKIYLDCKGTTQAIAQAVCQALKQTLSEYISRTNQV